MELTQVIETFETEVKGGALTVRNEGGYLAFMRVSFWQDGKEYSRTEGDFAIGQNRTIQLPSGAYDIFLKVECVVWPFPRTMSTIFTKNYDKPETMCFKVWGTTLSPQHAEIPC